MQRRELAIAGGGKVGKDRVTRLLAAEFIAALVHLFKHIAVADTGTNKTHTVFAAELMQPQIRHHRCHDRAAAELAATLHIRAADSEHLVTVDDAALLVDAKAEVIVERLSSRRTCRDCGYTAPAGVDVCPSCGGEMYQRDDDKPETIQNRLNVYESQTAPLVEYYKGKGLLKAVDGDRPVDDVYADVKELLAL